jgi:hypothetical protein
MKAYAALFTILVAADQLLKQILPTPYWGWDSRGFHLLAVALGVGACLTLVAYPPIRLGGIIMLAGITSNVLSASHGDVPNPFVINDVAFNLADILLLTGMLVLFASTPAVFRDVRQRGSARGWK